ncbi:DEAD/DEAH box helicase [Rarobacter incanus]|uniref:RAD3-like DEAD/DEAH box helicase n=1 Tax=Rarobacter incanus TaxID=153494 RepID=A0A542SM43_9MICO|nr:DEAD/DEAH box helicase [Rarobacter incanus]TQK75693.1 RAD3-like DEAD/DEAH box helicase [Rarobacter incanus]
MATDDFAALRDISNLLLTDENEQEARNRFIRFLDQYSGAGSLGPIVDSLAARLGLFPYMSPNLDEISDAEALTVAYHSPRSLSDQGFTFHAEQQKIYERLMDGESVILSAPTSFGKSAIVDALVLSGKWENFVIIVPTISLIDETRRRLVTLDTGYTIVSHPSQQPTLKNIYVLTQERFLELSPVPEVDFFIIDEFYKLGDGETDEKRRSNLNIAWRILRKTGAQYYLLGPKFDALQVDADSELSKSFITSDFNPVVVDVEDRSHIEDRLADMKLFLDEEADGPSLIFVSSPRRANEVAFELATGAADPLVIDIADWIAENYDPEWYVAKALRGGVGTHTGPMPRSLQRAMVRLFAMETIDRLVCTTTLIEGVNTVARNVVIYDKKIDRKPIDFFTFSNIRGRAGRMLKHFVGRVVSYADQPQPEISTVDLPIESQSPAASLATLIQLDESELTEESVERLREILEQDDLSIDTIRSNRGLDPLLQIGAARHMREAGAGEFRDLSWTGVPTREQLTAVVSLGYDELISGRDRSGENARSILAKLGAARTARGDVRSLVEAAMPYMRPGQTRSNVVDDVLSFQRNWMGFKIPSILRAASSIQCEVAQERGERASNYEYLIREIESLYLPAFIAELEDYGLPVPVGAKLAKLGLRGESIEDVVSALVRMARDQWVLSALTRVDRWFLADVASGLTKEMPTIAPAE